MKESVHEDVAPDMKGTTLRSSDGSTVIPTIVPPAIEFPFYTPDETPNTTGAANGDSPRQKGDIPAMTLSGLPVVAESIAPSAEAKRPDLAKQWRTERPKPAARISTMPGLRRKGTNVSLLNEAIWNKPVDDDSSSSSSSSSEDEDEGDAIKAGARERRKIKARNQLESEHRYRRFHVGNENFKTRGKVSKKDGRLNISVNETNNKGYLAKTLGANFVKAFTPSPGKQTDGAKKDSHIHHHENKSQNKAYSISSASSVELSIPRPKLNIVVMVIGSRGDIQPFLKLGKILKEEHGHRVRIATHPAFRDFVQKDSGLEFFSVGGDPAELMAFMVKNPGMIPSMETVRAGEIGRRRNQMAEMFQGFWRACINTTDDEKDQQNMKMLGANQPFVADAIIANPPCFAHIHCAERLGVPLHLMFTFPYTPTQDFPHPLANIKKTNVDPGYTNFMSYPLVEMMTWQGLGDLVNNFRVKTLGLEPVSTLWAPGQLYRLKVPYTYMWSPGLVPKPADWGPEIDIAGFVFLDLASSFKPPEELVKFLDDGEPPVYIGFGSIVVDDPDKFTSMIFEAIEKTGVRALVSKGWGGLGSDNIPDNVFMLENTPHDWLFPRVKAVVHHGGAGTTAIGLKCGKPTMIVPFFGDQQFWGSMIGKAGAGADPIPYKSLTTDKLADGIKTLLTDEAREAAEQMARDIEEEGDGAQNAVKSFHRSLQLRGDHSMRCSILEDRVAVWKLKNTNLRLSALAADILIDKGKLNHKQLRLIRHTEWNDFEGPGEPITGGATAIMGSLTGIATGIGSVPFRLAKSGKRRAKHEAKKRRKSMHSERKSMDSRSGTGRNSLQNGNTKMEEQANGKPVNGSAMKETSIPNGNAINELAKTKSEEGNQGSPGEKDNGTANNPTMGGHSTNGAPCKPGHQRKKEDDPGNKDDDSESDLSDDPDENAAEEYATQVGKGLGKTTEALARAPMDLSLAVAQGFHNAPRLYGDRTVRTPTRITGMKSGLKAAGEEFVFGLYDGFTGVVTLPYRGARDDGAVGFAKGVGMGLTGFVLKDISAIIGPFGYTFKGVHKELLKSKQPTHFIRKARIIQGQVDFKGLDDSKKKAAVTEVLEGWSVVQQVFKIMQDKRAKGLGGRFQAMKERKTWRTNGAFENVHMAQKALDATRRGESLDEVFAEQRKELEETRKPRRNVVKDINLEKEEKDEDFADNGGVLDTSAHGNTDGAAEGKIEAGDVARDATLGVEQKMMMNGLKT